jgi:localization factor PodJL
VAARLDPQTLASAKLTVENFTAEPQPEDVIAVRPPAGGWDNVAPAPKTGAVAPRKPAGNRT